MWGKMVYRDNAVRKENYYGYQQDYGEYNYGYRGVTAPQKKNNRKSMHSSPKMPKLRKRKRSLKDVIGLSVVLAVLGVIALFFVPTAYHMFTATFMHTGINNVSSADSVCQNNFDPKSGVNYNELVYPTLSYSSNYTFFNQRLHIDANEGKKAQMSPIRYGKHLEGLEKSLKALNAKYPNVKPSILVWSIDDHSYAKIDSDKIYPCASIIKLPVLIQLYKSIEAEQFGVNDSMFLTEYYRSPGSGNMQYAQVGRQYSISQLAAMMIQDSDNTATNMLMSKIGSMNDVNAALKNWGIKHTRVRTWLPDLTGNNYTTAEDMAQMLYNITDDNNSFLNVNSQCDIINIMGKVKNVNLIKAGLPANVEFIHKTGDIGKMLGDAGVVYMPSGERYIVVILAYRPHNDVNGKLFIQQASKMIYNYMYNRG